MPVDANYQPQSSTSPVRGAYVQPGPGITEQVATLANDAGVSAFAAAGTESLAVLTVQGSAAGTAIPVSGSGLGGGVAQASTTAAQLGTLVQGAVTTNPPTYVTGQTDPLSLTTTGLLRTYGRMYRDAAITAQASAKATSPGALGSVATVTPGTAGMWEVAGTVAIAGTTVATAESHNMQLRQTSTAILTNIPIGVLSTTGSEGAATFGPLVLNLGSSDTVNVVAVGAATTGAIYAAQIVCRLVG